MRPGLLIALLLACLLVPDVRAQELPEDVQVDVPTTVLSPIVIYGLRELEKDDPANTIFQVESAGFEGVSASGNPTGVAEYLPLADRAAVRRLYFLKALEAGVLTLEADAVGGDSLRLRAAYSDPGTVKLEVRDTKVFHRLEHRQKGIVEDLDPGDRFNQAITWQRIEGKAEVNLGQDSPVSLTASVDDQIRTGLKQHSWFKIHRFNCTDCHTVAASRGISESTRSYNVGLRGSFGRNLVEASVTGSDYDENGRLLTFNYGGPFGYTPVFRNHDAKDRGAQFRAGVGEEDYRAAVAYVALDRTNVRTGQDWRGSWLSVQGAGQLSEDILLTGGLLKDEVNQSLATNLTRDRSHLYLQVNAHPVTWARVTARVGQEESRRRLRGIGFPKTQNRYYDVRAYLRPAKEVRLTTRLRHDDIDDPFFPTDPSDRTLFEAGATFSPEPVVIGLNYRNMRESNGQYALRDESTEAYVTALLDPVVINATYNSTDIDSDTSGPIFLDDALGNPLQIQQGYPYRASTQTASLGVDFPIGELWVRPMYRRTHSKSEAMLVLVPVAADSRVDLDQDAVSIRLDYPLWEDGRLGVGWERQDWSDRVDGRLDGSYDIYTVYYTTRF
ncbi:MAG: hypothetical protein HY319_04755 [Armatimonadetes bacterium]|nr:hypothetical protein [Armatimonadota bacterium]